MASPIGAPPFGKILLGSVFSLEKTAYLLDEYLPLPELVVVPERALEQRRDGGVVGQHQAGHAVRGRHVR